MLPVRNCCSRTAPSRPTAEAATQGSPGELRTSHLPPTMSGHACRNVPPKMLRTGSPSHLSQFTPEIAPLNRHHTSSPPTEHQPVCNTRAALERLSTVLTETDWRNWSARPPSATTNETSHPIHPPWTREAARNRRRKPNPPASHTQTRVLVP